MVTLVLMKRLLIIIFVALASKWSIGQGIFHYYTGLILPKKEAPVHTDRLIMDFYYNTWQELPQGIQVKPYSIGFNVSRIYDIPFGHSWAGIGIGWGFSSHNIHHNGEFVGIVDPNTGAQYTDLQPLPDNYEYSKNKISLNYVDVPFEFRLRTKGKEGKKRFRFYPGFRIGYRINIHTATIDNEGKFKTYNFPNAQPLQYGATLRTGIGIWNLYGYYSLTKVFQDGKGVDLQPFHLGISITVF